MFTNIIIYFKSKFFRFIILCNEWVQIFFLDYFFEISFNIYCSLHYRLSAHFGPTSINLLKFRTCFLNFNSNTFKLNLLNFTNFLQKLNLSSFFFLKILFLLNIYESFFMSNFFFKTNTFLLKKFFFGLPILILLILKKKFFFVFSSNTKVCCV